MSLTKDWLGLVTHHVHLCYLYARVKISREVFNHHVWISISLSVVSTSVSILLNSFRTGCSPIRPSKAADAYEFPAPVSSSARHRIPQTSTTTTGQVTLLFPVATYMCSSFLYPNRDVLADWWVVSPSAVWTFRNSVALLGSVIWTGAAKT